MCNTISSLLPRLAINRTPKLCLDVDCIRSFPYQNRESKYKIWKWRQRRRHRNTHTHTHKYCDTITVSQFVCLLVENNNDWVHFSYFLFCMLVCVWICWFFRSFFAFFSIYFYFAIVCFYLLLLCLFCCCCWSVYSALFLQLIRKTMLCFAFPRPLPLNSFSAR